MKGYRGYRAFFITSLQLLYHFIDSRKEEIWPLSLPKVLNFSTPAVKKDEITDIPPNYWCHLNPHLIPQTTLYPQITPYIPDGGMVDCGLPKIACFLTCRFKIAIVDFNVRIADCGNFQTLKD